MSDKPTADSMHEQLQMPFASPRSAGDADRHGVPDDEPAELDETLADSIAERDTEPYIDAQILRAALQAGLK